MARKSKREQVTVSFHYLVREELDSDNEKVFIPFTSEEFEKIYLELDRQKNPTLSDSQLEEEIKSSSRAIIQSVEKVTVGSIEDKFISGKYQAPYWGHSFENSQKGKISADSLNFRSFFFLLYLSDTGRIYIASQYLGNYGGYIALRTTIISCLKNRKGIKPHSFSTDGFNLKNAVPKELKVTVSEKTKDITKRNSFNQKVAFSFTKTKGDDLFQKQIENSLLSNIHEPKDKIIRKLVEMLSNNDLVEVSDEDIDGCDVIVRWNKGYKTVHLLDGINYASKFPVDVAIDNDGHPHYEPLKHATIGLLKEEVISRKEDV